jgi:hypothetical protein
MMSDQFSSEAMQLLLEALDRDPLPFVDVRSDSMAPFLRRGDQIQLGPIDTDQLVVGDLIVVGEPEDLLVHRYCGTRKLDGRLYLLTRGDRLAHYDGLMLEAQLRAIVIARRRSGRTLTIDRGPGSWLNRRLGWLSQLEAQIMGLAPPNTLAEAQPTVPYGFGRRLTRRLLVIMAYLLTTTVGLLTE